LLDGRPLEKRRIAAVDFDGHDFTPGSLPMEQRASMNDFDLEHQRRTYQLCRLSFGALAVALVTACVPSIIDLFAMFHISLVQQIRQLAVYDWLDTPIIWGSLLGAMLLFGRWDNVSWQRRAGLLLVMNLVDVGLWFMGRGEALGLQDWGVAHAWLRANLGTALGWAEFALMASLSADYLVHLGVDPAKESGRSARSMAATGAVLWALLFCEQTDWGKGWPLQQRVMVFGGMRGRRFNPAFETFMLLNHGFRLIWTITLVQVTAMVLSATRESTRVLAEIEHDALNMPTYEPSSGWQSQDDGALDAVGVEKEMSDRLD
jgi:hypothetical protein